jgi:hypothetical protein
MLYDVFICHASEDKESFVRPLADALRSANIEVWYDAFSLKLGDSVRRSIDKGLSQSRFGVVVLSRAFFEKRWTQYELDGLVEREMRGQDKVLLPVWHDVTADDVALYSPALAGRMAAVSSHGLEKVVDEILAVTHPQGSPLICARDVLLDWGVTPPVITDEYWLDVVEASNRVPATGAMVPDEATWGSWSFPLPHKDDGAQSRGERLAWTAMQMRWVDAAESPSISPLSHPDTVLEFIDHHAGLFETCCVYPDLLAEYAPQLTIPGFEGNLVDAIEKGYRESCAEATRRRTLSPTFGSALTTDGESRCCEEEWTVRHPSFGNYEPAFVANAYFAGGIFGPPVSPYEHADHLFWLLSDASSWLPSRVHEFLLKGMADWSVWPWHTLNSRIDDDKHAAGALFDALHSAVEGKDFEWSDQIEDDVSYRIQLSVDSIGLPDRAADILERFLTYGFPKKFIACERSRRCSRANTGGKKKASAAKKRVSQRRSKSGEAGASG